MILITMLLQATAPAPAPDAVALSRQVAEGGALIRMLPVIAAKEADEMVKDHPELSAAERADLRATATTVAAAGRARLIDATAPTYAAALTVPQMDAIVAFDGSDAAKARRAADLPAMMAAAKALDGYDFKNEVLTTFCAKTGKACARK